MLSFMYIFEYVVNLIFKVYYESYRASQKTNGVVEKKLGIDDYSVAWIAFIKGLLIGSLITYYIN